jgi:hypothetical protein
MQRSSLEAKGIFPAGHCDVYVCPGEPTIVVRYGDEGWEYASGPKFQQLYKELRYFDDGTRELAKAIARHGRKKNRKWQSDFRRQAKRTTRRFWSKPNAIDLLFSDL